MGNQYNKLTKAHYEGKFIIEGNKRPKYDNTFLNWCIQEVSCFSSLNAFAKHLGVTSRTIGRIFKENNIVVEFGKYFYRNYDWLCHQMVTLQKPIPIIAKEYGWTVTVLERWAYEKHRISRKPLQEMELNLIQQQLIRGSILGDGHITNKKYSPFFIVSHAENQKDYLFWKYEILKNLCNKQPTYYPPRIKTFKIGDYLCKGAYRFNTRKLNSLIPIRDLGKLDIINTLTPFEIAIWLLDDGTCHKSTRTWSLCLGKFEEQKNLITLKAFEKVLGVKGTIQKHIRSKTEVYADVKFGEKESKIINKIILEHIPNHLDIIQYKLFRKGEY